MYSLNDDKSIIIKGADKGAAVIVWDCEDYVKEDYIFKSLEKIRKRGDLSQDTFNYLLVKEPKFVRFYLLPKIHKRLYDVPGRPVISNCGFCTENISSLLDFHLQPLAQKVKLYIKDTNHFLRKIKELGQFPEGTILYTINVVTLYPNIPHDEGLSFLKDFLDSRVDKQVITGTLIELAELLLKNSIFEFSDKTYRFRNGNWHKVCSTICSTFSGSFERKLKLNKVKKKLGV